MVKRQQWLALTESTGINKPTLFSDTPFSFTLSFYNVLYPTFQTTIYTNRKMKLQKLQEIKLE